jgi:organic hydroperoxide reductase OsmC/OhrA
MQPFPHRYTVNLVERQLVAPPRRPIAAGAPPQFGGSDRVWSPEELLVGAVLECLWTTFEAYAQREGLVAHGWSGQGVGVLDRSSTGPVFTSIALAVTIVVDPADVERARNVLATAERHCIVARALNVPITLEVEVEHPHAASA